MLLGGPGNDFFRSGPGFGSIVGGPGIDTVSYEDVVGRGVRVCLAINESCSAVFEDVISGVEIAIGSRQSDFIDGSDVEASAVLRGLGGGDSLVGSFNDDRLFGGPGADVMNDERAGDDVVHGGSGDDLIGSQNGDDLLFGDGGGDLFDYDLVIFAGEFGGKDVVGDLVRGEDVLDLRFVDLDGNTRGTIADFDSNGNGRLDDRDAFVEIEPAKLSGATATSTVIDVGGFAQRIGLDVSGGNTLTTFGVTGLTAADLVNDPVA